MTNRTVRCYRRPRGFTLIELLIVIIILAILTTILVPAVMNMIKLADNAKARAFVQEVGMSARTYAGQHNQRYPGQDDIGQLTGSDGPDNVQYTGSQILAARLFGYVDAQISRSHPTGITNEYLAYKAHMLMTDSGRPNTLADNSGTAKPLLYFPSRLGVSTPGECYKWADNSVYAGGGTSNKVFTAYATSKLPKVDDKEIAQSEGEFLIIGTGPNDKYLESGEDSEDNDDNKSWEID